ncbi:chromate efflux transporter [Crenothrix sp.]|uniref:chromate efflux transporter n=1 Tax=Crenothrix sp. TaxID=3100433 RepID=UPI00374CCDAD
MKKQLADTPNRSASPATITFLSACLFWFKLGFISFGGPAGQISVMHQELVERKRWISERRFLHALNYCMLLPGPEAQQLATYLGWLMHRTWGGIIAGLFFILPSLFLLIFLSGLYVRFGHIPEVAAVLYGIKPAVTAIVLFAAYRISSRALKNSVMWGIAGASFLAIFVLHLPFPLIVLLAALVGAIGGRFAPEKFATGGGHSASQKSYGSAVIDDNTPTPDHAHFSWPRLLIIVFVGLILWGSVLGFLCWHYGWNGTFTQISWFFTKAALLTFGGAYAVLPYVYQGAVEHYHWLSATQMMDGLALGETTPGPLIMIVTFVGFLSGWTQLPLGDNASLLGATIAACLATYFTFLPSFVFILAGGPIVESTQGKLKFTAPLTAITAAVVGVILNLAVFFAWHVFWPAGLAGTPDYPALLIFAAALLALLRYKVGVIAVIAACASAGVLLSFIKPWLAQQGIEL